MKKEVVIIGLGRFGISLANALSSSGYEVLAMDIDEHRIQTVSAQITHAVQADATDETILNELGVKNFDIAVVAIGSDIQSSVLTVVLLKNMGIPLIIARANNQSHGEILRKIGADKVVFPEYDAGNKLAHELQIPDATDYLPITSGYSIVKIKAKDSFDGQSTSSLGFGPKGKQGIALLLIQRGNEVIVNPGINAFINKDDILIISGSETHLESFLNSIKNHNKPNNRY